MGLLDIMSRYEKTEEKKEETNEPSSDSVKTPEESAKTPPVKETAEPEDKSAENTDPYFDLKNMLQKQAVQVLNEKYTPGQKISRE